MYLAYKKDNLNKILFILLMGFFMLLVFVSPSFADDEGIMPLGLITDTDTDENSNTTISYSVNDLNKVTTGSFTISSDFRNSLKYYAVFVFNGEVYLINSDQYPNLVISPNGSWIYYIYTSSDFSAYGGSTSVYKYNSANSSFDKVTVYDGVRFMISSFTPNGYIYGTAPVYLTPYQSNYSSEFSGSSNLFSGFKANGYVNIYASKFDISSPYLFSYENNVFKFALKSFYPGYSYIHDEDTVLDINLKTLNDFTLNIYSSLDYTKSITLSLSELSNYIEDMEGYGKILNIDLSTLPIDFSNSETYIYEFSFSGIYENNINFVGTSGVSSSTTYNSFYSFILEDSFTVGEDILPPNSGNEKDNMLKDSLDEQNKKLDEQTDAIKENTETNKNIFERIGEMLSYINPFSENFFVYKLIELLINAIKSLFIPSDDFFSTYFTDLKEWFSDRLGFLFYPFELIIDVLSKILNINLGTPTFNIPDMYEPFTGGKFISATTFNLNSMLENNIFKTVHDIYLVCVDAFITFELVNLFKRKYEEVTTK